MMLEFGCWYPWRREDAGASSDFVSLIGALVKQKCSVIRQAFFYMYIICNEKRKKKNFSRPKLMDLTLSRCVLMPLFLSSF